MSCGDWLSSSRESAVRGNQQAKYRTGAALLAGLMVAGLLVFPVPTFLPAQYWLWHSIWHMFMFQGYWCDPSSLSSCTQIFVCTHELSIGLRCQSKSVRAVSQCVGLAHAATLILHPSHVGLPPNS